MLIFAHRGLKKELPENSLEGFILSWQSGFGIELDIRLTADRDFVIIHDRDPFRVTGIHGNIGKMTMTELQKLDISKNFSGKIGPTHLPTFTEVCEAAKKDQPSGQKMAIHMKLDEQSETGLQKLVHIFQKYGLHKQAFIFDLTLESAGKIKKMDRGIEVAISVGEKNYTDTIYTYAELKDHKHEFDFVWWDEWQEQGSIYNQQMAEQIHADGKPIFTISPELHKAHGHPQAEKGFTDLWRQLVAWDVDGICTDDPKLLTKFL